MDPELAVADIPWPDSGRVFAEPVFVLCNGRSGSTLLRFLLDAHPDLACPPETNLPSLCVQLATVWSLIEGAPLSPNRGDEPPEIPDAAIQGIRETMDRMVGSYLARRGKKRYCDKSLGTARYAELLMRVYPDAKFICLYRHPMDVIASGMEACPWGLNGYGFDSYIASTPGNAVLALARFWADNAGTTLAAEERFAEHCVRVRYEDLVIDPEGTAARMFAFLGVPEAPGISEACFSADRERFGPGDHKIWCTSKISSDSVGRGWSVPAAMIPPPVLAQINELAAKLGYLPVDGLWGTCEPPADLRVLVRPGDGEPSAAGAGGEGGEDDRELAGAGHSADLASARPAAASAVIGPVHSRELGARLLAGLAKLRDEGDWQRDEHQAEKFVVVSIPADPGEPAEHWLVDLKAPAVSFASRAAQEGSDWDVIGSASAWEQVLAGRLNLSVALRACQIRYCDGDDSSPMASDRRIGLLAAMLALANWSPRGAERSQGSGARVRDVAGMLKDQLDDGDRFNQARVQNADAHGGSSMRLSLYRVLRRAVARLRAAVNADPGSERHVTARRVQRNNRWTDRMCYANMAIQAVVLGSSLLSLNNGANDISPLSQSSPRS
jgi:hypothetical protein